MLAAKCFLGGVGRIRANCVWDNNGDGIVDPNAYAGQYVRIAVIDSGIDYYVADNGTKVFHPDLADNVAGGLGFRWNGVEVEEESDYHDAWGHGTMVAGVIAAVNNGQGIIGTAPKVRIYALESYTFNQEEFAAAINWSILNGIRIICMAADWSTSNPDLRAACDNAYAQGVLLFDAAGNFNSPVENYYPVAYDSVVAVGATYPNDTRWELSNYGPKLEFAAPGFNISSTSLHRGYATDDGTSYACPHVAGAATLMLSSKVDPSYDFNQNNHWDNIEARKKLQNTTLDLGNPGKDDYYGYGLVNAWYANQRPPGDVNNDRYVNIKDAIIVGVAFGSKPGDPNWDPRADIIIDNIVNIKDSVIVGSNFGKHDP